MRLLCDHPFVNRREIISGANPHPLSEVIMKQDCSERIGALVGPKAMMLVDEHERLREDAFSTQAVDPETPAVMARQ
jgi:hypothetical protein